MNNNPRPSCYHPENTMPECTMHELLKHALWHIEYLPNASILHMDGHPLNEIIRQKLGISLAATFDHEKFEYEVQS